MRLLVYAANLHNGGGVQVATSVIYELSKLSEKVSDLTIWASSIVDENLQSMSFNHSAFAEYEVVDHRGALAFFSKDRRRLSAYDGVLVIFGPHYFGTIPSVNIVGFAQRWIINEHSDLYKIVPFYRRRFLRLKYWVQGRLFKRADWLVAELEGVRDGLVRFKVGVPERVRVVRNCISSVYLTPDQWSFVSIPERKAKFRLGFVGRNYPHKNTNIFPRVLRILHEKHALDVEIFVTFTNEEWGSCTEEFRSVVKNVGPLTVAQCPTFYRSLDAVIFPSLLECFSATPLEAMVMKLPLFASDRSYVSDICGDFADYFDPLSPEDVARTIASKIVQPRDDVRLNDACRHALGFSNARDRARKYLELLREATQPKMKEIKQ